MWYRTEACCRFKELDNYLNVFPGTKEPPKEKDNLILIVVPGFEMDLATWDGEKFIDYYFKQNITSAILYWMLRPEFPVKQKQF